MKNHGNKIEKDSCNHKQQVLRWAGGKDPTLDLTIVGIISFIMQNQLIVHEIKRIRSRLEGTRNHLVYELRGQCWKLVNVLTSVLRVGNAIWKIEIESFQQPVLEEMTLNHSKVFHVSVANLKLHAVNEIEKM